MRIALLARLATRLAKGEAREIARVAAAKAVFGLVGAIFALFAVAFTLVGLYGLLSAEIGPVLAAFCMSGACLLVAILCVLLSLRVRKKPSAPALAHQAEDIAHKAGKELRDLSPYIVLGAFILGFLQNKK